MIRLIAFAAFALALATSAQAMPRVPLHQPDGMTTQVRYYGYRHYGYRHYGYRPYGYRHYGYAAIGTTAIGTTVTAGIGTTGTGRTAIGPTAMESPAESPAAISAEESSDSETPGRLPLVNPTPAKFLRVHRASEQNFGTFHHVQAPPWHL